MKTGIIILVGSSLGAEPCISGKREINVPKKNTMGVVTRIQNFILPMRLMLECRIAIVPPQNDKNIAAVSICGKVTIRICSNPGLTSGKVPADSKVVTGG